MKRYIVVSAALLLTSLSNPVFAKKHPKAKKQKIEMQVKQSKAGQRQKLEIKAWKKRKAAMQPLQFKELIEENHRLKTKNQELTEEIKFTREELEQLIKLQTQIEELKSSSWGTETGSNTGAYDYFSQGIIGPDGLGKDDWAIDQSGKFYIKGLVFKVQIGAYKQRDLSNVLEGEKPQEVFEQERLEDVNMYTLRHFRDYWKANQFKKELRAMGLKDAWIVAFQDGKRVPLKDVVQEITKKK